MKTSKLLLISVLFVMPFCFSCKKSTTAPITYSIQGFWRGTYAVDNSSNGNLYYSFTLNPDNKIYIESLGADGNTYYSVGTWSLSAMAFSCTVKNISVGSQNGVVQTETATFDNLHGLLTGGKWVDVAASGTFELSQVK